MAHRFNSEEGAKARRTRAGYAAAEAHRRAGRVPGEIAREAKLRRQRLRKMLDGMEEYETGALLDAHGTLGEQLRKIARAENHAPDADDADAGVILEGID